mgnify:CR=1 FL=1
MCNHNHIIKNIHHLNEKKIQDLSYKISNKIQFKQKKIKYSLIKSNNLGIFYKSRILIIYKFFNFSK